MRKRGGLDHKRGGLGNDVPASPKRACSRQLISAAPLPVAHHFRSRITSSVHDGAAPSLPTMSPVTSHRAKALAERVAARNGATVGRADSAASLLRGVVDRIVNIMNPKSSVRSKKISGGVGVEAEGWAWKPRKQTNSMPWAVHAVFSRHPGCENCEICVHGMRGKRCNFFPLNVWG